MIKGKDKRLHEIDSPTTNAKNKTGVKFSTEFFIPPKMCPLGLLSSAMVIILDVYTRTHTHGGRNNEDGIVCFSLIASNVGDKLPNAQVISVVSVD